VGAASDAAAAAAAAASAFSSHAAINAAPATAPTTAPATAPATAPDAAPATLTATMAPDTAPLVRTRKLSLIDVIVGAIGTAFDPETPLVLHGGLSHVGELCGLVTPPAALVAPPLLLLLAGPPAWRAVAAAGLPHDPANRSGTWRLADVLVTALLLESLVVSTLAPRLLSGELGTTLRTFARVERLELSVEWGVGTAMLVAAALCDALGRVFTSSWGRGEAFCGVSC
jgi:hypothetical protein